MRPLVRLTGLAALRGYVRFFNSPLIAVREAVATYGPFVMLVNPLPVKQQWKVAVLTSGADFNREILGNPAIWRTVSIAPGGPLGTAARRLGMGIIRMKGQQHAHYRKLLVPPLRKPSVETLGDDMARLAEEEVDSWKIKEPLDLWACARRLMRSFAIALLFGGDRDHGYPIADMISQGLDRNWSLGVIACPINMPGTPYGRMLRGGEVLERRILDWAERKRGRLAPHDLLSILVNNPDENGNPLSDAVISGHVPTLFGAAYETCQNALIWTLILLVQHPRVLSALLEELRGTLGGAPATLNRVQDLPLLNAVIKESMRILPPVPTQFRVAEQDTTLAGHSFPRYTRVLLSAFLTNRHPDLYSSPDRFRPDRWATIDPSPFEYSAFSAGPRSCPGSWFGLSVVKVALSTIVTRYRVNLAAPARIDYKVRVALSPRRPVMAVLHHQDGSCAESPITGNIRDLVTFEA